jgi:hypothetical protein
MRAKQLEPYEALTLLRRAAPWAAPNPGFLDQLGVWADMGWRLDERHPAYKAFQLDQVLSWGAGRGLGGLSCRSRLVGAVGAETRSVRLCTGGVGKGGRARPPPYPRTHASPRTRLAPTSSRRRQVARQYEEEGSIDRGSFAELPPPDDPGLAGATRFRCRKCRVLVATDANAVPPGAARGARAFRGRRRAAPPGGDDAAAAAGADGGAAAGAAPPGSFAAAAAAAGSPGESESSIFLEPMAWMEGAIVGPTQGKLYCPGCGARLGSFNWAGAVPFWRSGSEDKGLGGRRLWQGLVAVAQARSTLGVPA